MKRNLLDLLFPPQCCLCLEETRCLLCPMCLHLLAPIDPKGRCRHCFFPTGSETRLCKQCAHGTPALAALRAFLFEQSPVAQRLERKFLQDKMESLREVVGSFAVLQWGQLNWPMPDRIAIVPKMGASRALREILDHFACMINVKTSEEFCLKWGGPFQWTPRRKKSDLLEDQTILLLDWASPVNTLRSMLSELWPAFPKQVCILSLFDYDIVQE